MKLCLNDKGSSRLDWEWRTKGWTGVKTGSMVTLNAHRSVELEVLEGSCLGAQEHTAQLIVATRVLYCTGIEYKIADTSNEMR